MKKIVNKRKIKLIIYTKSTEILEDLNPIKNPRLSRNGKILFVTAVVRKESVGYILNIAPWDIFFATVRNIYPSSVGKSNR